MTNQTLTASSTSTSNTYTATTSNTNTITANTTYWSDLNNGAQLTIDPYINSSNWVSTY